MERWTRAVVRFRWLVVGIWVVAIAAGFVAFRDLNHLLSNTFTVPGTDSERARTILQDHFGDRSDGEFLVIYKVRRPGAAVRRELTESITRGAAAVPGARATALRAVPGGVLYGSILSRLNL